MSSSGSKRIIALDMLRGYALVCIMLDHMPISVLKGVTLSKFALFDAAELFVLLSGFLVGLVWRQVVAKTGQRAAQIRFWRRSFEVWRALVIGAILMALLSAGLWALGLKHTAIWTEYAKMILERPIWFTAAVGSLWMQPNLLDVLAAYVVLLAAAPLVMPLMLRQPWGTIAVIVGSVLIWRFAIPLNAVLPNHRPGPGFVFNPFGWQVLFFAGAGIGAFRTAIMSELAPWRVTLNWICGAILIYGLVVIIAARLLPADAPFREFLRMIHGPIDKWSLDGMRFLSIMAASWLVAAPFSAPLERLAKTWFGTGLAMIGKGGLWSFIACVLLSVLGDAMQVAAQGWTLRLMIDLIMMGMLWLVAELWMRRAEMTRRFWTNP